MAWYGHRDKTVNHNKYEAQKKSKKQNKIYVGKSMTMLKGLGSCTMRALRLYWLVSQSVVQQHNTKKLYWRIFRDNEKILKYCFQTTYMYDS